MKVKFKHQEEVYLQKYEKKDHKKIGALVLTELGIWSLFGFCLVFYLNCSIEACDGLVELDPYNDCSQIEEPGSQSDPVDPVDPVCTRSGDSANPEEPLKLCSYADLELIREDLDGHYLLGQDLNMPENSEDSESIELWKPIGDDMSPFQGTFDGGGHVISNLRIVEFSQPAGFFGRVSGTEARITNLFLEEVNVQGRDYVGALVGYNQGGTIQNSYAAGTVIGNRLGMLIGQMEGGSIENSYAQGVLQGGSSVGGLLGYNDGGEVKASYALVEIRATHSVGGLVGYHTNGSLIGK